MVGYARRKRKESESGRKGNPAVAIARSPWKTLVPKEHGAWAMLLVPFAIGAAVAGRWDLKESLLLVSVLCLYVVRNPLFIKARTPSRQFPLGTMGLWLGSIFVGVGLGLWVAAGYGLWWLFALGAVAMVSLGIGLYLVKLRLDRSVPAEFLGIATLTLTAPAAYYTALGRMNDHALLLWLLNILFFGTSIFYVRMKVEAAVGQRRAPGESESGYMRGLVIYLAAELLIVMGLALLGAVPALAPLALVPIALQTVVDVRVSGKTLNIKRIGFIQLGHSLLFALLLTVVFHL